MKQITGVPRDVATSSRSLLRQDLSDQLRQPMRLLTVRTLATVLARLASAGGHRWAPLGHIVKQINQLLTGADIAWQSTIGPGLQLYHPAGVVIGPGVRIGARCRIQQGVTLGGMGGDETSPENSPTIGDDVHLGAGAKVIGEITVGNGARIGANAVVIRDAAPGSTMVGVPARAARGSEKHLSIRGVTG